MTSVAPRFQKDQLVDVRVTGLAFGGKGIARIDDFVLFVTGAVPGDLVSARVTKYKKRYAEARAERLLDSSPNRRPARCVSFGTCGGCAWQNLDYGVQLEYKAGQVRESLEHLGGFRDPPMMPIVGMNDPWRYRNRADFSIGRAAEGAVVGFRPPGRWDAVLPLSECHLLAPVIEGVRATVETWLRENRLAGWDPRAASGFARHLLVRSAQMGDEVLVSLVTALEEAGEDGADGAGDRADYAGLVERLRSRHPQVVGVVHAVNAGRAEISSGLGGRTLWGRPFLLEHVAGVTLKVSLDAFFQTNTTMTRELYGLVACAAGLERGPEVGREAARGTGEPLRQATDDPSGMPPLEGPVIWDLYCGVGSIGLSLAGRAKAVLGIETIPAAVADARENAHLNSIGNADFLEGDVARVLREVADGHHRLPERVARPDVIVVDPPRAGLAKKAISRIGEVGASRIVYVSCNPATMAPNLTQFREYGYRLDRVTPVDMFPHTPHVEAVALLTAG